MVLLWALLFKRSSAKG